jgi:hypothetical protein
MGVSWYFLSSFVWQRLPTWLFKSHRLLDSYSL